MKTGRKKHQRGIGITEYIIIITIVAVASITLIGHVQRQNKNYSLRYHLFGF